MVLTAARPGSRLGQTGNVGQNKKPLHMPGGGSLSTLRLVRSVLIFHCTSDVPG